ncbi:probable pectinesterase/pectinesterase inhibitor 51 isoform X2 [Mercurialis annua]|uniref:probable pectinesterase/pectinesterase inhibitor 51 isoform X2 n=1 Tax=Mercurialis annua TaxID=3986 RepID=UPI00215F9130|nr:probable pectinesterase/pectinesterase inhibitor 51 isoform X2 [Mercurialis annua]
MSRKSNAGCKCMLYILVVSLLFLILAAVILLSAFRHKIFAHSHANLNSTIYKVPVAEIQFACQATRFPDSCISSLSQSNLVPSSPTPLQIIESALLISSQNIETAQTKLKSLVEVAAGNENVTNVAKSCMDLMRYSLYRISLCNESLPLSKTKNARASMSAALAYQYDCYGGLTYHGDNSQAVNDTTLFLNSSIAYSSNALSMIVSYDLWDNQTRSWRAPRTERDGFWEGQGLGNEIGFKGEFPLELRVDVIVCKNGRNGCYKTVQEAVNAAPSNASDKKFVIHIKEGVYEEIVRVPLEKKNVVFVGDGIGKTVITGSLSAGQVGVTTYESATVGVLGDGFMASGLTIQNTAGAPTHQAVAFRSDSDLSFIENCEFIGHQDTLYAHSLRQYYKSCRIQGNVDFIFGNSAAIFQDCEILVNPRQEKPEKGENNALTAHGRTDPAQSTGFVFQNCLINGTEEYMKLYQSKPKVHKNYLGRPWKEFSRVVFIHCNFEAIITPEGWMPWTGDFALKTLYYGEFENSGPGSNVSQRVPWSNRIPAEHVYTYSVQNFIQGDEWISTSS